MAGGPYNGYPWAWRIKILEALDREREQGRTYLRDRCDICEDHAAVLHSEDYSLPYTFSPPQTYSLCRPCHRRVHRRFKEPPEMWCLWLEHLKAGGYGAEFSEMYPVDLRQQLADRVRQGQLSSLPRIRLRHIEGAEWWLNLSLDSDSLGGAWARPRPLRSRPSIAEFLVAIPKVGLALEEELLLRCHARAPRCSISMEELSARLSETGKVRSAASIYKSLGFRLSQALSWTPDKFRNGYPNWASLLAEQWKTTNGDCEWLLISPVRELLLGRAFSLVDSFTSPGVID